MSIERLQSRLWQGTSLTPFRTISYCFSGSQSDRTALLNLAGNIVAFGPMGFLLPILFPKIRSMRHVAGTAMAISLSLETVQLLTGLGSFDVDDVLLNVLGAILGWFVYQVLTGVLTALRGSGSVG